MEKKLSDRIKAPNRHRPLISPSAAGRMGAGLFAFSGIAILAPAFLRLGDERAHPELLLVGFITLGVGAAAWFIPWRRFPPRATLSLFVVALGLLIWGNLVTGVDPYSYGTYFVLLFAWVGMTQPRWSSLIVLAPAWVAYILPLVVESRAPAEIATAAWVLPVCVLVAEVLAWGNGRLRATEEALIESEATYRLLFDNNPQPMWVYDAESLAFLAVNEAAIDRYGYSRDEFLSMTIRDIRPAEDVPPLLENVAQSRPGLQRSGHWRHRTKDGTILDVEITSQGLTFEGRSARQVQAVDVTDRYRALMELEAMAAFPRHNPAPLVRIDGMLRVLSANPAAANFFGVEELVGAVWPEVCPEVDRGGVLKLFDSGGTLYQEMTLRGRTLLLTYIPVREIGAVHIYGFETTDLKRMQAQLSHLAYHDTLTGLPNRELLRDRIDHALARRIRRQLAVMIIDLTDFKTINDSLGHSAGDRVLVKVAERLGDLLRPEDTIARLGGDEFSILIEETSAPEVEVVAARILAGLGQPVDFDEQPVILGASIGIALTDENPVTSEELLRNADVALHIAKEQSKPGTVVFEARMHEAVVERLSLRAELARAIANSELSVHYQPIVHLESGVMTGVEALVRWNHPTRGIVAPAHFIPSAEETGLVIPIGRWVLTRACMHARAWNEIAGGRTVSVSVNLSGRQLGQPGIVAEVTAALEQSRLAPELLTVEITETVLLQDIDESVRKLKALKDAGVRIAIDDFGTGYSGLAYLQRLPVDVLKIDKSFVDGVTHGTEESALAHAIVKLGDSLGLRTIAEGIETLDQAKALVDWGCGYGQGFLFSKPMEPHEIELIRDFPSIVK